MLAHEFLAETDAPPATRARLEQIVRDALAVDLIRTASLRCVLDRLAADGVPVLIMKGAALAHTCYPAPHLRPRNDDDLVVSQAAFASACTSLERQGYIAEPQASGDRVTGQRHFARTGGGGTTHHVDLHWRLVNPAAFDDLPGFDTLAAASVPLPGLGRHARGFGSVHALLLACAHRVAHHTPTEDPQWLLDMHLIARTLDDRGWAEFAMQAEQSRLAEVCASELRRTREAFGTPVPDGVLARLAAVTGEPTAEHLGAHDPLHVQWLNLRHAGGWRARLTLVRQHVFPPPAYMLARDRPRHPALLPWLYVRRAGVGLGRWIREARARRS